MCNSESSSRKYEYKSMSQEDWDRAKEKWNEMSQKFSTRMNEMWNDRDGKNVISVTLPNGRQFSFTLGHIIAVGLALWLLPFNLLLLGGLLYVAYKIGNDNGDPRKHHDDDKPKRKLSEPAEEFEIYNV